MTKQDFRDRVKGLFSVRWIKNDGTEGYIHRGILGLTKHIDGSRWANVNPNTITEINSYPQ